MAIVVVTSLNLSNNVIKNDNIHFHIFILEHCW